MSAPDPVAAAAAAAAPSKSTPNGSVTIKPVSDPLRGHTGPNPPQPPINPLPGTQIEDANIKKKKEEIKNETDHVVPNELKKNKIYNKNYMDLLGNIAHLVLLIDSSDASSSGTTTP